jgi:hypothetical protein
MANTTNYNWETPDDTDLVKDGAAAIRTLGSSIDTTTKNLNPETTTGDIAYRSATANTNTRLAIGSSGQVLTVAGGVPSWATPTTGDIEGVTAGTGISGGGTSGTVTVTNSMATAIDAKGDLIVGTGADTFARLAVGTNGHTLVADSAEATGLKWAAAAGGGANWSVFNAGGTDLTGAATITVSGISGANKIMVLLTGASSASAGSWMSVRLNGDTGSNYFFSGSQNTYNTTYSSADFSASQGFDNRIYVTQIASSSATSVGCGYVLLDGCDSSGVKIMNVAGGSTGGNGQISMTTGGYYNSSSVITSVSAFSGTGNFDAGKIWVLTSA